MANSIIQLKYSSTPGNTPVALANGEIAINTYDGKIYYRGGPSNTILSIQGSSQPSGLNQEVQFNDNGTLGANADFTYDKITGTLEAPILLANSYIQFRDGTRQYTANAGSGGTGTSAAIDRQTYTATAAQTTFAIKYSSPYVLVLINGAAIDPTEYTATNNTSITLVSSTQAGDIVDLIGFAGNVVTVAIDQTARNTANAAFDKANTGTSSLDQVARDTANASFLVANTASDRSLSAGIYANGAFVAANSGGAYANYAFIAANTASDRSLSASVYANGSFTAANSAGIYANGAFATANTANNRGLLGGIYANGAFEVANSASIYANGAFARANNEGGVNLTQNTNITNSGNYANGAFTTANTASDRGLSAGIYANGSFVAANSSGIYANGAFTAANNRLLTTGGTLTGNLRISGNITPTTDLTWNIGNSTNRFHSIFIGPGSVYVDNVVLSNVNGNLSVSGADDIVLQGTTISLKNVSSSKQNTLISGTNIKTIDGNTILGSGDFSVLPAVANATGDIHGVFDRAEANLSFDNGTRSFTITPVGNGWRFYHRGTLYSVTTAKSNTITNTSGARFIYIDPSTLNLVEGSSVPDFENNINLAYVYWDAANSKALIVGDERHGSKRDTTWHSVTHVNVGTVWRSGGGLSYTLNDSSNVSLSIGTPLIIQDEDLTHTITHSATPTGNTYQQILNGQASLEVLYLNGTTYTSTTANTSPWIKGSSLAAYNQISGGVGSIADATEGSYITYWLLATNDIRSPVKLVLGRTLHASLDDAYAEDFVEYGLSFAEQVFMYQIVVQTSSAYTGNPAKIEIVGVRKILSKVSSSAATVSATVHNNLTGRDSADAHPISAITNLQASLDGKQANLVSGTNIKTINGNSILGSGDLTIVSSAQGAYDTANAAFIAANSAGSYANAAFLAANTSGGGSGDIYANGAFVAANSAGSYANAAFLAANVQIGVDLTQNTSITASFAAANTSGIYANGAFIVANAASLYANSAYTRANNSLNANTGGVVSGTLNVSSNIITSNLTVTSNATSNLGAIKLIGFPSGTNLDTGLLQIGRPLGFVDTDIIVSATHNVNSYAQMILQNQNSGSKASADFIVNNDRPGGTAIYGDFGINSSTFSGLSPFNQPDGVYLYGAGASLTIGTSGADDFEIATSDTLRANVNATTGKMHVLGDTEVGGNFNVKGTSPGKIRTINFVIDGGGSVITAGPKGNVFVDFAGTIDAWTILGDTTGNVTVDISKSTYSTFPTFTASGGTSPALLIQQKNQRVGVNWTGFTSITANDIIRFVVSGTPANVTSVTVALDITSTT